MLDRLRDLVLLIHNGSLFTTYVKEVDGGTTTVITVN